MRRKSEGVVLGRAALTGGQKEPWPDRFTAEEVVRRLSPFVGEARKERLRTVAATRSGSVTVLMDAPHDPHNGAAIVRSADAFGLHRIHVVPRDEPFVFSTTVTRGSEKWVDVVVHDRVDDAVASLRSNGFRLVATHPEGDLVPEDLRGIPKVALVLGNEHDGIREELERAADARVRIPMRGFAESLNLSVSAAILIRAAMMDRPGDLSAAERARLVARGLYVSLPRPGDVLEASE